MNKRCVNPIMFAICLVSVLVLIATVNCQHRKTSVLNESQQIAFQKKKGNIRIDVIGALDDHMNREFALELQKLSSEFGDSVSISAEYVDTEEKLLDPSRPETEAEKTNRLYRLCIANSRLRNAEQNKKRVLEFIVCEANAMRAKKPKRSCQETLNIDQVDIGKCVKGPRGHSLLVASERRLAGRIVKRGPLIFINDEDYSAMDPGSYDDLLRSVCVKIPKPRPQACESVPEIDQTQMDAIMLTDSRCSSCDDSKAHELIYRSKFYPRMRTRWVDVRSIEGRELYESLELDYLPVLIFPKTLKQIESNRPVFANSSMSGFVSRGDYYLSGFDKPYSGTCDPQEGMCDAEKNYGNNTVTLELFIADGYYSNPLENAVAKVNSTIGEVINLSVTIGEKQHKKTVKKSADYSKSEIRNCVKLSNPNKLIKFISHQNSRRHDAIAWQELADMHHLATSSIQECLASGKGKNLVAQANETIKGLPLKSSSKLIINGKVEPLPRLLINGKDNGVMWDGDLIANKICDQLGGRRPKACLRYKKNSTVEFTLIVPHGCTTDCRINETEQALRSFIQHMNIRRIDRDSVDAKEILENLAKESIVPGKNDPVWLVGNIFRYDTLLNPIGLFFTRIGPYRLLDCIPRWPKRNSKKPTLDSKVIKQPSFSSDYFCCVGNPQRWKQQKNSTSDKKEQCVQQRVTKPFGWSKICVLDQHRQRHVVDEKLFDRNNRK